VYESATSAPVEPVARRSWPTDRLSSRHTDSLTDHHSYFNDTGLAAVFATEMDQVRAF
jgi:hypothetical protein